MVSGKSKIVHKFGIVLGLIFILPFIGYAETATELVDKISEQNKAIENLEKEITQYQQQLNVIGKEKDSLSKAVKTLSVEAQKLGTDLKVTEKKIVSTDTKISTLGQSIKTAEETIDELQIAIGKSLRELSATDSSSLAELLVNTNSLSDVWHHAGEQLSFRNGLQDRITELSTTKHVLVLNKSEIEEAKEELLGMKDQIKDQESLVKKNQADKNSLLAQTKNQESAYAKLVADKLKLKQQLEAEMREYESKLKYVLDPSSLPTTGSTTFIWPLDNPKITQLFGKTVAAQRLYTSGSHNGVDFGVPTGTPVKAMASGTVVGTGNADLACKGASYGIWVLIKYDNGLAGVYGHLSLSKVTQGQKVKAGDIVAYSGATGYATGPHLHVSIFPNDGVNVTSFASKSCAGRTITIPTAAANAYLNPMLYLPKK